MADLFSNVPIPQPLDPLQKPKASDSPLVTILTNQRARQFEAFKIAEQARIDDMNTLAGFDIGKLGRAFGGLFQDQVDRARDMFLAGGMTPAQQKALVLDLVRDYNKYMTIHVNPFNEAYGIHSNLSTNPQMLDQYNKTLPVGQQYNPMSIEDLAITKDNMMNRVFDPDSVVFDENGNVTVVDEITGKRVKPEMVTNVGGDYNSLFKNQIQPTDIGTLYDWGQLESTKKVVSRQGLWNKEAANDYFDLNIGLMNRTGAIHRAQLLDTYENEMGGQFMTDKQRDAFITMDPKKEEYATLFDENGSPRGLAATLFGDEGHKLWKKASYFEPKPDAQRRQAADDYRARNLLINSGREDKMPVYNVPSTARLIGKVGDDTTIPLIINGEVQYAIPQYHYIDAQGRNVLRASVGTGSDDLSTSFGGGSLTMRTEDIVLDGVNYDAVDQYVRAMHGGATLEDLKAGKLAEASDNTGSPLNNLWGSLDSEEPVRSGDAEVFPVEMATGSDGSTYRPAYQVSQERYDSALSAVRAAFRETPGARGDLFDPGPSLFAGISNPNMTADKNLETLVKDLVDVGYTDSQISTAMATPEFYDELRKIGYRPRGAGLAGRLRKLLSALLDAVVPGYESAMSSQRREAKRVAEETIESISTPEDVDRFFGEPGQNN